MSLLRQAQKFLDKHVLFHIILIFFPIAYFAVIQTIPGKMGLLGENKELTEFAIILFWFSLVLLFLVETFKIFASVYIGRITERGEVVLTKLAKYMQSCKSDAIDELDDAVRKNLNSSLCEKLDPLDHLRANLKSFRDLLSELSKVNLENIDIKILYTFTGPQEEWQLINSSDVIPNITPNELVRVPNSSFNFLNIQQVDRIFEVDKTVAQKQGRYSLSPRDDQKNSSGSVFGERMLIDGADGTLKVLVLVVSYGNQLCIDDQDDIFKYTSLILPIFYQSIQSEFYLQYMKLKSLCPRKRYRPRTIVLPL